MEDRLLLFVSFDLVNSTKLKTERADWPKLIHGFYARIHESIHQTFATAPNRFERFKILGDEVVYHSEVSEINLADAVKQLYQIGKEYNDKQSVREANLATKSTCWLALIDGDHNILMHDRGVEDYLGIHIDEGFRLSKHSFRNMMVISPELAFIMHELEHTKFDWQKDVRLLGYSKLKGIWKDHYYPIILYCPSFLDNSPYDMNYNLLVDYVDINLLDPKSRSSDQQIVGKSLRKALNSVDICKISPIIPAINKRFGSKLLEQ